MGKKYLLYIHDELFEKEPHKSELINNLLERHYHDTVGGKTQDEVLAEIRQKQRAVCEQPIPDLNHIAERVERHKREKVEKKVVTRLCKHGYPLGECFDRKSDRSCKI